MMTLANYGIGSSKRKDPNSAKVLSKSLQIRNRAELMLKQYLKSHYRISNERRSEILNLISDYYSRIPFNIIIWNKYQTKQCIIDSILLLDSKFDPYKAREAFKCVENMLINLVYLPWHQEFRRIHTYSGQFKLAVSGPLIGVEELLKAAGFQQSYDCPMHLILPDNKMPQTDDGESVTSVIFDCMLAQTVCSNIIEIFEHCCRSLKQSEESIVDINCYNWIQAYFRERSQQTTERACANIQELLNNITNHLSKLDLVSVKSIQSERIANKADKLTERNGARIIKTTLNAQRSNESSRESPKLTAQARTREFLAQQAQEDENLLTLTSDLLRLPTSSSSDSNSSGGRKIVPSLSGQRINDQESISCRSGGLRQHQGGGASDAIPHQQSLLNNGYNPHQYHRQALYDRGSVSSKTQHEPYESIGMHRSSDDSLSNHHHPAIDHIDSPHNDRELLLPRYDRRLASHQQGQLQSKKNSFYDKNLDINHQLSIKSNGVAGHLLGSNRYADKDPESYFTEPPSHAAQLSSNHQLRGLSSSSKYVNNNDSTYRKYESRDADDNNKSLANSRSYWSCSSCTYNNPVNSEICEICRSRRPSR